MAALCIISAVISGNVWKCISDVVTRQWFNLVGARCCIYAPKRIAVQCIKWTMADLHSALTHKDGRRRIA